MKTLFELELVKVVAVENGIYEVRSKRTNNILWNTFDQNTAIEFAKEEDQNIVINRGLEISYVRGVK
jgi:hypothetical protein